MAITYEGSASGQFNASTSGASPGSFSASQGSCLLIAVVNQTTFEPTAVTYGGNAMTLVSEISISGLGRLELYKIESVVTSGSQTIQVTHNGGTSASVAGAISYLGVQSVSAGATSGGNSFGLASHAATVSAGQLAVQVFGLSGASGTSGGTNRINAATTGGNVLILSDSASSVTFGTGTSRWWSGIQVILTPKPSGNFFPFFS